MQAKVGILLPRDLFHNRLDELVKELGVLNFIFRSFSVIATGTAQPIEVRQISTTDPQFFFGIDPATTAMIATIVTWALSQWKKMEEIRKLRAETKKNQSFTEQEIKDFFDSKIDRAIRTGIEEKVTEILGQPPKAAGVDHAKRGELAWALESILARIERGMTVEVRFVPPPAKKADAEGDGGDSSLSKHFAAITQATPQLVFPVADATPVLQIPPPEPAGSSKAKSAQSS